MLKTVCVSCVTYHIDVKKWKTLYMINIHYHVKVESAHNRKVSLQNPKYNFVYILSIHNHFCVSAENLGCFGASKKKKDIQIVSPKENPTSRIIPRLEPAKGMELLWQPEV